VGLADLEAQIDRDNQLEKLDRALSKLSPKCRAAFVLHRREGLTYAEVAEKLGVSSSMVKKYLATALAQCHRHLSNG
jgi:RNA polymerase sigma-70 factor (ECF subfamily)